MVRPGNIDAASRRVTLAVFFVAIVIALVSARPYAGSWNDGSRLATVESLVDHGTWQIDRSIFVQPSLSALPPYPPEETTLRRQGTQDKLLIGGHYYSDKSPVPALWMAGVYQVLQWTTGLVARAHPGWFCYLITLFSSGLAYVIAVGCIDRLARELKTTQRVLVTASFALATTALPYARQVNNHILLLAVACAVVLILTAPLTRLRLVLAGLLVGAGYAIDLGLGPILVLSAIGLVGYRTRRVARVALVLAAAFPWFALHHYLNWRIGGTFSPANAQPAYLSWPGSPFDVGNMTGHWAHASVVHFVGYAFDLLFGKRGFFGHDLALFLAAPGAFLLVRRRVAERPEIIWAASFFLGGWLIYAATSNNFSGVCASIRWYVPLLAPAYYVLVQLLRHAPRYEKDLAVLTSFGVVIGCLMWWQGPWMARMVPGFWFLQLGALLAWLRFRSSAAPSPPNESRR